MNFALAHVGQQPLVMIMQESRNDHFEQECINKTTIL